MYDEQGEKTWDCTLDVYGKVANFEGSSLKECPFRYQGQYEETGLYYNRFRYYEPELGSYISQDTIGLKGGNPTIYGYVYDTNGWIDEFGLSLGGSHYKTDKSKGAREAKHMPSSASSRKAKSGVSHGKGPTTSMEILDHMGTASWGNRNAANEWRKVQEDLIRRGKFGKAMEMDIKDVKRKFGNKYNDGMTEMVDYAMKEKFITRAEGSRLKRKHLHH